MKHLATIMLAATIALTVTAQQHVNDALDRLSDSYNARRVKILQESDADGHMTGQLVIHTFSGNSLLRDMLRAFDQDQSEAYYTLTEQANDNNRRTTALTYGTEGESVLVGKDPDTNYRVLCFIDPANEDFRHGYVVEWTETDQGDVEGRVISTYGKRPSSATKSGNRKKARVFSLGDLNALDSLRIGDDVDHVLREIGPTLKGVIGDIAESGADVLDELKNRGIDLEGVIDSETLKGIGDVVVGTAQDPDSEFTDDVSWLTAFNHYRNAFLRAAKRGSSSTAAYATSVLKLCKQAGKVHLTDNEKRLCTKSIKEMRKATRDTFVQGLLDEATALLR